MSTSNKLFQAASGGAGESVYVEDVFSTYLYDGIDNAALTIDNGIALADEGGMIWFKARNASEDHCLYDTERGAGKLILPNTTDAQLTNTGPNKVEFRYPGATGFQTGQSYGGSENGAGKEIVSWTFRKQAGFFDVVTYTGDGVAGKTVAHNLGSVPAVMIIKRTSTSGSNWRVYHTSLGNGQALSLNRTDAAGATTSLWNSTTPTDSVFTLGDNGNVNQSGQSFVAYLFAHDDQSFGDNSDESIIKCGSYTGGTDGSVFVDLGFEPQFLILKKINGSSHWAMMDTMRGLNAAQGTGKPTRINANERDAENTTGLNGAYVAANGFYPWGNGGGDWNDPNGTYAYIAIRRPMKTPEAGTEVFNGVLTSSDSSTTTGFPVDIGFPVDLAWVQYTTLAVGALWMQRLTGLTTNPQPGKGKLAPSGTTAEANSGELWGADNMTGYRIYGHTYQRICYGFKRATGVFDMVAYTGDGANSRNITHNLGVAPELIIVKSRSDAYDWHTFVSAVGNDKEMRLNSTTAPLSFAYWGNTTPTSTVFTVSDTGGVGIVNGSNKTYIAYLFATLAGVSKVGSVVHSGTTNVDCGFSAGARFVMVKRTDQNGDWYYWDTVRGIVAGNDDYLLLNSDAVEVTNTDYIDPLSSGFTLTSSFTAGTYIFLAIA